MINWKNSLRTMALALILLGAAPQSSHAASVMPVASILSMAQAAPGGGGANADANCTDQFPQAQNSQGLLTQIVDYIKEVVQQATQELYEGVTSHQSFISALNAAFALFVTLFGVMFMFGIVPLSLGQAAVRLFKFGIILAVVSPGGFAFFNDYVIRFFNDGTDELIDGIIGIATGGGGGAGGGVGVNAAGSPQPFTKLEGVVQKVLSSKMMISMLGTFLTGPSGAMMGGLLAFGMIAFIQCIIKALKVYCLSLIAKALLFGLAPIFISFILFERTKNMFMGWVNQLVNFSLQPLLMFAFISFFIILLESSADNILGASLCWTEFDHMEGSPQALSWWRFKTPDGKISSSDFTWQGLASCVKNGGQCPDFPISVIDLLTFLILAHLAYKFSDVVTSIASEIANSTLLLDKIRGGMTDAMSRGIGNKAPPPTR